MPGRSVTPRYASGAAIVRGKGASSLAQKERQIGSLFPHDLLDFGNGFGSALGQNLISRLRNEHIVLDTDADFLFQDIYARLDSQDHTRFQYVQTGVPANSHANRMAQAVEVVFAVFTLVFDLTKFDQSFADYVSGC